MINVLFVCLGNICRSPLAEGIFCELVKQNGLTSEISCDSAGTHSYHIGNLPDHRSRRVASNSGLMLTHRARKLVSDDFGLFDYVVAMDESNFQNIQILSHRSTGFEMPEDRLFLMREFDTNTTEKNIPDPYYEDIAAFEEVYKLLTGCCENLLAFLVERHRLSAQ